MRWLRDRDNFIFAVIFIALAVLLLRLFVLTVLQHESWAESAKAQSTKTIYTSAPRGDILDRYGRLIAGSRNSFTVQFTDAQLEGEEANRQALQLIRILEKNGDEIDDELPIVMRGNGSFYYTYDQNIREWLLSQNLPADYTAEQAFQALRNEYGIDEGKDVYEAQEELQTVYNVYPPISVKKMAYMEELERNNFLERYDLNTGLSAKKAFYALREYFEIDESLSDEDARKIIIVRDALKAQGYRSYVPVTVAQGISTETIVTLEEKSTDLTGVDVVAESVRYYPNGNTAAHVLGYLGKISESDKDAYVEKGYSVTDIVGKEGLERVFESSLKGTDGVKELEVNASGELVRVISESEPKKGKDLYLTIDLELQKTAEEALEQALRKIQTGGTFESKYGNYKYGTAYRNANVGAVVALDVETADVLAFANYPSYDPNLFVTGISKEDWDSLQSENPRDPLSPLPLYNVASMTAVQPGSTFKMVTATAALESGLNPEKKLKDGGAVKIGNRTYGCLIWNRSKGSHGYLNLYEALEVSCNYYFFDLVANKDWYTGSSLGLSGGMGIEKISEYATKYGLGQPTGIEIPETVVSVPSEEKKIAMTKTYLRNVLQGRAELYFTDEIIADKALLKKNIDTVVEWTEENPSLKVIKARLEKLGVREDQNEAVAELCKYSYFNQAQWTVGDELNISIGQGENAYTPLQMANYVATIGNGGVLNQVSLVKGVEGKGLFTKEEGIPMGLKDSAILDDIIKGMNRVAQGPRGSGKALFSNFPVSVAAKTGTAERAGKVNPPDEIEYLKSHLGGINGSLTWMQVEKEMKRLMRDYPDIYTAESYAARQAIINLSDGKVTAAKIDAYKGSYDPFAWFVALAPAEDPQIAVAVLIFQGGSGGYGGTVAREVIGKYLDLQKEYEDYQLITVDTQ